MDMTSFKMIDTAYQKDLEKHRKKIEAELKKEGYNGFAFDFPEAHAAEKINDYPSTYQQKEKARKDQEAALEARRKQLEAEIERRMAEPKKQLLEAHFGEFGGRDTLLEQAKREEKTQAFKQRQREREERERSENKTQVIEDKGKAGQKIKEQQLKRAFEQDNSRPIEMQGAFNKHYQQGKQQQQIEEKIQAFKQRQRDREQITDRLAQLQKQSNSRYAGAFNAKSGERNKDSRLIAEEQQSSAKSHADKSKSDKTQDSSKADFKAKEKDYTKTSSSKENELGDEGLE